MTMNEKLIINNFKAKKKHTSMDKFFYKIIKKPILGLFLDFLH